MLFFLVAAVDTTTYSLGFDHQVLFCLSGDHMVQSEDVNTILFFLNCTQLLYSLKTNKFVYNQVVFLFGSESANMGSFSRLHFKNLSVFDVNTFITANCMENEYTISSLL